MATKKKSPEHWCPPNRDNAALSPKTTPVWQFMERNPSMNQTLYPRVGQINLHSIPGGQLRIPGLSRGKHPIPSLPLPLPVAFQGLGTGARAVTGTWESKGPVRAWCLISKDNKLLPDNRAGTGLGAAKVGHSRCAGTPAGCEGLGQPGGPGRTWAGMGRVGTGAHRGTGSMQWD